MNLSAAAKHTKQPFQNKDSLVFINISVFIYFRFLTLIIRRFTVTWIFVLFVRCVCNIDCSHISFNPVCASDGRSYDNPCQVKEASCQKQERIEVKYLGHCHGQTLKHTLTHWLWKAQQHFHKRSGSRQSTFMNRCLRHVGVKTRRQMRHRAELNAGGVILHLPPAAVPATFHNYRKFHSIKFWNGVER